jgi:hypothetical protein
LKNASKEGSFFTMPPHTWKLWHQIFGTFTSQSQMNHWTKRIGAPKCGRWF